MNAVERRRSPRRGPAGRSRWLGPGRRRRSGPAGRGRPRRAPRRCRSGSGRATWPSTSRRRRRGRGFPSGAASRSPPAIPIEIVTDRFALPSTAKRCALDERPELLAQRRAFLDVGLGQDQHELLAAVAADHVAGPEVRGDRLGDPAQDDVARGVAVGVVDGLEVVDVDEGDRERSLVAGSALDLGEERGQQGLAVGDAGQPVDRRAVVGVGQRAGDAVDRARRGGPRGRCRGLEPDRVVAGGDPLGRLDEAAEPEPDDGQVTSAVKDTPIVAAAMAATTERRPVIDPRRRSVGYREEEDPDRDRGRKRQDPEQAHHLPRLPAALRRRTVGGTGARRPVVRPPRGGRAASAAGGRLLYSGRPRQRSGRGPRTRRSAIALGGRIGRPVRRPSDQTTAIRRGVGGATRETSIQVPGPVGGFFVGADACSGQRDRARPSAWCARAQASIGRRRWRPPDAGDRDRRAAVGRRGQGQDDRLPRRAGRDGRALPGRRQRRPHGRQRRRGVQAPAGAVGRALPAHHLGHRQRRRRQPGHAHRRARHARPRAGSTSRASGSAAART